MRLQENMMKPYDVATENWECKALARRNTDLGRWPTRFYCQGDDNCVGDDPCLESDSKTCPNFKEWLKEQEAE